MQRKMAPYTIAASVVLALGAPQQGAHQPQARGADEHHPLALSAQAMS
jgi:hypothetical protein